MGTMCSMMNVRIVVEPPVPMHRLTTSHGCVGNGTQRQAVSKYTGGAPAGAPGRETETRFVNVQAEYSHA